MSHVNYVPYILFVEARYRIKRKFNIDSFLINRTAFAPLLVIDFTLQLVFIGSEQMKIKQKYTKTIR